MKSWRASGRRRLVSRCKMLRRLAPRELECVRLRAEGLNDAEIAEVLSIRSGTVGALLSRALGKCRALLDREENDV
jgi:DNA-directed RNA polymerase specialized sigma24 family protein